ncbi:winged helix-turn-helix domain-containing protein [Ancylobacter pratisalsi]|uniref:Response regulator n=1 Tax=Ancylobacter pratisalsi TaxID=1745854 RepID=A0A6P1YIJ1_9HYPH|nr:winged helix-turn-helix domain-containing protein [Ancylobacter pratisalsi]QIB33167.1 response regulator [Ancylobacter pratisalsi]
MLHPTSTDWTATAPSSVAAPALNVLVVTSDCDLRERLTTYLRDHGCCAVGLHAMPATSRLKVDGLNLLVLDVQLEPLDGLGVLRRVRMETDIPVIMITRAGCDDVDYVTGLELGADDYLRDPLDPRELLARGRAILRRHGMAHAPPLEYPRAGWRFMGWELRRRIRTLKDPSGQIVKLSRNEFALLNVFLESPRRPLSRLQLMRASRPHDDIFDRSIDGQILRLRRKLQSPLSPPQMIKTYRGIGYVLDADVDPLF